ncbi:SLAP domain-containing protein, partial [Lactobacillus intestinalis]
AMHNRDYYKVGDNQYVVVGNIDGTKRVLKKNAYVYNNKGRRVYVPTLRRGITVPTYGSSMTINGKKYYRINKNRYVKVANFR